MLEVESRILVAWIGLGIVLGSGSGCVARPEASGLPGVVEVFAQSEDGPFKLEPRQMHALRRPQKLAFRWVPAGVGPRILRIRVVPDQGPERVVHEERTDERARYLDWLLELDARGPARFRLETEVVSPHDQPIRTRYGIQVRDGRLDGAASAD